MLRYKNYTLIKPNPDQSGNILDIIVNKDGSIFQEVDLNKIIEKQYNTELFYFVDDPLSIKNFSPVHIEKKKYGLKRYHLKPLYDIPYSGFLNDSEINFDQLKCNHFESIVYCGLPILNEEQNNQTINRNGETCIIDLNLSLEDIFNKIIHSKRRNMIRKAEKIGIKVRSYFNSEGLDLFWPILLDLHQKLGYDHLKKSLYKELIDFYGPKKQAYIQLAFKDDIPISGIFVLGNQNFMLYYKGASSFNVKNEGQGELLQWESIKLAKSLDVSYYDLGNLQKDILPAIYRFKTGISNRILKYPIYSHNGLGYKMINRILS